MYSKTMASGSTGGGAGPWKSRNARSSTASYPFSMDAGADGGRRSRWGDQGRAGGGASSSAGAGQSGHRGGKGSVNIDVASSCGATIMPDHVAKKIRQFYEQKVDCRKYELVAAFQVERGIVQTYFVYRQRLPFELTERRRQLMGRYYKHGRQEVVLYVNGREFEYYVPVSYQPLKTSTSSSNTSTSNSNCSSTSNNNSSTTTSNMPGAASSSRADAGEEKATKKSRFKLFRFK